MARLEQVRGVGTLIALTYLLALEGPHRFRKSPNVGCYVVLQLVTSSARKARRKRSGSGLKRTHQNGSTCGTDPHPPSCHQGTPLIAKHSPEGVSETGLPMEAREKNRCNDSDVARRSFSLVWFLEEIPRKVGLFRLFQEKRSRVSLQLRLHGGGSWIRTLGTVSSYALRPHAVAR